MLCSQTDRWRVVNDQVWHPLPREDSPSNTLHCQAATLCPQHLATPLLFGVRITFITVCNKCAGFCQDVTGAAIFHRVSSCSLTRVAQGQLDLLCSAKGQLKTCCLAHSALFLIPFHLCTTVLDFSHILGRALKSWTDIAFEEIFLAHFITFSQLYRLICFG